MRVKGIIKQGHQVASGKSKDSPYPRGSIEMQRPYFYDLGLDITNYFSGTLNVSIAPYSFVLKKPDYTFKNVQWNRNYPAETFSFAVCDLYFDQSEYNSLIYYPHPETKPNHFQDKSTLEILALPIANISYGDEVELGINLEKIQLFLTETSSS